MGTLIIRNLDEHVVERLEVRARENHRSLAEEIRHLLTAATDQRRHLAELLERTRAPSSMTAGTSHTDGDTPWREDRDRAPERREGWLGSMSDRVHILGDITTPTSDLIPWGVDE